MSIQHANRGIVKKDLQLYYNREWAKSFRGEATSNLIMNPSDANYYQGLYNFTVTPNIETAPDGTNNAWSVAWNGADFNYYSKNFPIVNSTVYTTSVFAKAGTHNVIWIGIGNMSGGENNASFNLTTGVATNGSPASTSCSMIYYGGGWWRCITTNTSGTSGATTSAMTVSVGANRATLGTVYLWGFQAERKSYATRFLDSLNPIRNQVATNLYSADPYDGLDFVTVYNYQGSTGASFSAVVGIANPINAPNVLQYNTGTSGYQYFALTKTGLASGTYTVSYYARLASGGPSALNNAQLWRDNVSDRAMDGDPNPTIYTYWRRFRVTALVTSGTLHFFPIHNNPITGGFTVYFTGFQLEAGNEPTSFSPTTVSTANTVASGSGLLDISGNNVNVDLTNATFNSSGYVFSGSQYITVPYSSNLDRNDFTITGYCRTSTNDNSHDTVVSRNSDVYGATNGWNISRLRNGLNLANCFRFMIYGDSSTAVEPQGPAIADNVWRHFAVVVDKSGTNTVTIYINGIPYSIPATLPAGNYYPSSGNPPLYIGCNKTNADLWNGDIAQILYYQKALTAAEVLQNFNATRKTYGL